jgi:hypothetical protein
MIWLMGCKQRMFVRQGAILAVGKQNNYLSQPYHIRAGAEEGAGTLTMNTSLTKKPMKPITTKPNAV